jgi:uncharacterized membrane protein YdjX (TVP38/TMEM64 family)
MAFAVVLIAAIFGPGPNTIWDTTRAHLTDWQNWVDRNPVPAVVGFFLVVAVATALPLPVLTLTSLISGALFGTTVGALVTSLGYTAGVTIAFLVARWLLRERVRRMAGGWIRRVERGVARDGALYLLTLRLMPSMPFFLINVLMALTPISTRTYSAVSWVGSLPLAFLCAAVGTGLASLESPSDALSARVIGALVGLALLPLFARKAIRMVRPGATGPETGP